MVDIGSEIYTHFVRGRKWKKAASGWTTIDGICCIYNGESRPDTRSRAAFRADDGSFMYTCRNCSFKAGWKPGNSLSSRMKDLLGWAGVQQEDLRKLEFKIWQVRETAKLDPEYIKKEWVKLDFHEVLLPEGAQPFSHWIEQPEHDQNFIDVLTYLAGRGDDILTGYDYYWTPSKENDLNRRVIIPFRWDGKLVGWTARAIFPTRTRYYTNVQTNYFFNTEAIKPDWEYLLVNEGPIDGIAVNGIAMLGDKISPEQIQWLNHTGKTIIVVPDREKNGGALVDVALREGWHVTFPKWDAGIKDAAEAVKAYGKLYTIWSIIDARTNNRLQINIERQRLK